MPDTTTAPPIGDLKQAEKYIDQLITLLNSDKATITHSDLSKFETTTIQDHYRVGLGDYDAEISHSINSSTHQPLYIMVFTNVAHIKAGLAESAILSYVYLNETLFTKFKMAADTHFDRKHREAEAIRFSEAMKPVDELLSQTLAASTPTPEPPAQPPISTPAPAPEPNPTSFTADFLKPTDQ